MRNKRMFHILSCLVFIFVSSCNDTLQCERHFFPKGFIGKVRILFNKENGQRQFDNNGCIVYQISSDGECFSALPFVEGTANPNVTFKYFEVFGKDSIEIFEFEKGEYLTDTVKNGRRKYIFISGSGYDNPSGSNPNQFFEYYVDYGVNYKKY